VGRCDGRRGLRVQRLPVSAWVGLTLSRSPARPLPTVVDPAGHAAFKIWQFDHQRTFVNFTAFNITNPSDVLQGARVNVVEVRPTPKCCMWCGATALPPPFCVRAPHLGARLRLRLLQRPCGGPVP
jgi:hypothetical protein